MFTITYAVETVLLYPRGEKCGLEASRTLISVSKRTKCGTPDARESVHDPDLADLITRWPDLSEKSRSAILAIVRAAAGRMRE